MSIWVVFTFYFSRTFAFDQYWCFHWLGNPALKFYSVMFGNCVQSRGIVYISPGKITSNDKLPSNKKVTRTDLEKTKNISAWLFFLLGIGSKSPLLRSFCALLSHRKLDWRTSRLSFALQKHEFPTGKSWGQTALTQSNLSLQLLPSTQYILCIWGKSFLLLVPTQASIITVSALMVSCQKRQEMMNWTQ